MWNPIKTLTASTASAIALGTLAIAPVRAQKLNPTHPAHRISEVVSDLSDAPLTNSSWQLVAWDGADPTDELPPMTARFTTEVVRGSAGCNTYFAEYDLAAGDRLTVSPPGTTRRACEPQVMEAELDYLVALEAVTGYAFTPDGHLVLSYDADTGAGTLEFAPLDR